MIDFHTYDTENPHVYEAFKAKAIQAMQKGFTHFGHKAIFEVIRWETKTAGNDGFKINNNYTADYARKLMAERAEFRDFFHVRTLRAYRGQPRQLSDVAAWAKRLDMDFLPTSPKNGTFEEGEQLYL